MISDVESKIESVVVGLEEAGLDGRETNGLDV